MLIPSEGIEFIDAISAWKGHLRRYPRGYVDQFDLISVSDRDAGIVFDEPVIRQIA